MSFFYKSPSRLPNYPVGETFVLCHEVDSDGKVKLVRKEMSSLLEPMSLLSYTDFQLSEMIKNGVSYKSLNITDDMRLGREADFEAFEKRFTELESQIFEQSKN